MRRPVDGVLEKLTRLPSRGRGWKAICPLADGDREHVLKVDAVQDGRVVLFCHNGCPTEAVLSALGLHLSDLFPPRPVGRGRRGPAQSLALRLARSGLADEQIRMALTRRRYQAE